MANRSESKAAKIRALLAERPEAKAREIVDALAAQKVKVSVAQVYNVKATSGKSTGGSGNGKPAAKKANGYESLIQAKKLADAMGGLDKARAAMDLLAKLV
jgi:hypothetical protein